MENIGLANVFHEFVVFQRFVVFPENLLGSARNLGKTKNSWKTLAWPMFSMNSCEKTMENIGLANVFHEFVVFLRISWDQPGIYEIQ